MAGNVKIRVECDATGIQEFEVDDAIILMLDHPEWLTASFIGHADVSTPDKLIQQLLVSMDRFIQRWSNEPEQKLAQAAIMITLLDYLDCYEQGKEFQGRDLKYSYTESMTGNRTKESAQAKESAAVAASKAKRYSLLASIFRVGADLLCSDQEHQDEKGGAAGE